MNPTEDTYFMEQKKSGLAAILGLIALIIVLFAGIKLVFWGMGAVMGRDTATVSTSQSQTGPDQSGQSQEQEQAAPAFCPYCGQGLFDGFQWGQFCPYCGEQLTLGEAAE